MYTKSETFFSFSIYNYVHTDSDLYVWNFMKTHYKTTKEKHEKRRET